MKTNIVLIMLMAISVSFASAQKHGGGGGHGNENPFNNFVNIQQIGESTGANQALVFQDGDHNIIGQPDKEDAVGIFQSGEANQALVTQTGSSNAISQYKGGGGHGGNGGHGDAIIGDPDHGGCGGHERVKNSISQVGEGNIIFANQEGDGNTLGKFNGAKYAAIEQTGAFNEANVNQLGFENHIRYIHQDGQENFADVLQNGDANFINRVEQQGIDGSGFNNVYDIKQYGTDNRIQQARMRGSNLFGVIWQGTVVAPSEGNYAHQTISHNSSSGLIYQFGEGFNTAYQLMCPCRAGDDNHSFVEQDGNSNYAYQQVGMKQNPLSERNILFLMQDGEANHAEMLILGDDNIALGAQDGNDNISFFEQQGDVNYVNLSVSGSTNYTDCLQEENGNTINGLVDGIDNNVDILQYDIGSHVTDLNIVGMNNFADVDQYSSSNYASVIVDGSNNQSFVKQGQ